MEKEPDLALKPEIGAREAGYFWQSRGLNQLADQGNFGEITKRINGGHTAYQERLFYLNRAKAVIGAGLSDYALITDFNPEDVIKLSGVRSDYSLVPNQLGGTALNYHSDRIAIIQGSIQGLNLGGNYFQFG